MAKMWEWSEWGKKCVCCVCAHESCPSLIHLLFCCSSNSFLFFFCFLFFSLVVAATAFISFRWLKVTFRILHRCYRTKRKTPGTWISLFHRLVCNGMSGCRSCRVHRTPHTHYALSAPKHKPKTRRLHLMCCVLCCHLMAFHHISLPATRPMVPTQSTREIPRVRWIPKCCKTHFDIYLPPFLAPVLLLILPLIHNKWTSVITKLIIYKTILSS